MNIIHGLDSPAPPFPICALTIGNFDGVHRGHQQIIAQVGLLAADLDAATVVLTFEPHPLEVVAPRRAPARLMSASEKLAFLAAAGVDLVVVARADKPLLSLTPRGFIERVVGRLRPGYIVEGPSFGFGRGRCGTNQTLRELGPANGFEVFIVDPVRVQVDGHTTVEVSSSLIRRLVSEGRVHRAALCLGRPYALIGEVIRGARRGATLGFPTANLDVSGQLVPAEGVYAGSALLADDASAASEPWAAAISIGTTPTFDDMNAQAEPRIEAHLLDADLDLYGRRLRLEFGSHLRGQRRFDSSDELRAQISRDVESVRQYTAGDFLNPPPSRSNP